ncbi:HAD family hydrolase [Streptacidiphilus albus]|uniref:HAD family hydrolase n=1 Tax=Streptacidiphilus albus TaxID=105425 RepID=UPI00054C0585|nr:HAD-IB family hydrolase [Streptacidiphilus albus]
MATLRKLPKEKRSSAVLAGEAAAEATLGAAKTTAEPTAEPAAEPAAATAEDVAGVAGDPRAAAFFDCDNTIVQGAAIFYLGRGLYKRKFFSSRELLRFAWQQTYFRLNGAEHAGHMADAKESALSIVQGHRVADLERICEEVFDEYMAEKIWPGTRALVKMHLEAGQRVWLVTAAPQEAARVIASRLGMTGALGTVAEAVGGVYTGRLVGEPLHGPAKAEAVRALAAREQLDLARCAAYSDSSNDIPLLSLVGYPYVINPDAGLRRHAREQGWRIRDFRTGRKAARVGIPAAAGLGAAAGGTVAAMAIYRNRRHR